MKDLTVFCARIGAYSFDRIGWPRVVDGYLYATNARVLVRVAAPEGAKDPPGAPEPPDFAGTLRGVDFSKCDTPFPPLRPDAQGEEQVSKCECRECENCNGTGRCECLDCGHEHDCEKCAGSGRHGVREDCPDCKGKGILRSPTWRAQKIGSKFFYCGFLALLHKTFTGLKFHDDERDMRPLWWVADGGYEGLLMPTKQTDTEPAVAET